MERKRRRVEDEDNGSDQEHELKRARIDETVADDGIQFV
jgi:hypothetical protein